MTDTRPKSADATSAARLVLESLGVSPADLQVSDDATTEKVAPTFREYVPRFASGVPESSRQLWIHYWRVLVEEWGDRRVDEPSYTELVELAIKVEERAKTRKGSRGGHGARSNFIDAVKCLYRHAVDDDYVRTNRNPTARLRRPAQSQTRRRALSVAQLTEINHVAGTTGPDPALDTLVLRQHTETACRRGGVLSLRRQDLNEQDCTVWLREKRRAREQPVSRTLMAALIEHFDMRNRLGQPDDVIFRYRDGRPIGDNYYQGLWLRLGRHLDWVGQLGVSAHWLRYTTLTWVERNFGYALAAAYAGHTPGGGRTGNTLTYVSATMEELATALAILVGEPHPLATVGYRPGDGADLSLPARELQGLLPAADDVLWRAELERRTIRQPGTPAAGKATELTHFDAVRLVRGQLEQAQRYGMRRPSQRTLILATGLTKDAVQRALSEIKLDSLDDQAASPGSVSRLIAETSRI